ncbi:fused MFS/spermidine synthase [Subsaxibacter sp. CAU 1640]|uniref:spermidine synthase n=1 Tax=Subsaxibacter sp. CAU 1640 TaxID=2933271 RepID=UPI002003583F|nr:fused MFS/spermidine synthase [Subsaxibacter sp. CAU 1640]MCK7589660.1 fused MFS/spermidine synthase [Subsaxibacter sp. CAU 1640]
MSRLLSYIYPITKKIKSDYSGFLEITWYNGKKHLNSKNANYSYGALQKVLKFGLEQVDLKKVNSILLLGLGGGCVIKTLRKDMAYEKHITAVEIDPVVIKIAKGEFGIECSGQLDIICNDAEAFMSLNTKKFDLIIIDLFIDLQVPSQFMNINFWLRVIESLGSKGDIIFNMAVKNPNIKQMKSIVSTLKSNTFQVAVHDNVNHMNTVIIAHKL